MLMDGWMKRRGAVRWIHINNFSLLPRINTFVQCSLSSNIRETKTICHQCRESNPGLRSENPQSLPTTSRMIFYYFEGGYWDVPEGRVGSAYSCFLLLLSLSFPNLLISHSIHSLPEGLPSHFIQLQRPKELLFERMLEVSYGGFVSESLWWSSW